MGCSHFDQVGFRSALFISLLEMTLFYAFEKYE